MLAVEEQPQPLIPFFEASIPAGLPSPAADYVERRIDLNERLVHDAATFFSVRAAGESMRDAGIQTGTSLVVNSVRIVIASVDGKHTVRCYITIGLPE